MQKRNNKYSSVDETLLLAIVGLMPTFHKWNSDGKNK